MKKLLIALLLLLINTTMFGQIQTQINGWNALITLPADYNTTNIKYPTLIFFPGLGEVGTDANKLKLNGPHAYLQMAGASIPGFIVISLQPPASYPSESATNIRIATLKQLYRIDSLRLNLTGLSHGGWMSATFVTGDPLGGPFVYANQVNTVITVQGVTPGDNQPYPQLFANFKGRGYLCFEQRQDFRDGQTVVNYINSVYPGKAQFILTNFSNGGHCCWNQFYGGQGVQPGQFGLDGIKQNIYEWLVTKNTLVVASTGDTTSRTTRNRAIEFYSDRDFIYLKLSRQTTWALYNATGQLLQRGVQRPGAGRIPITNLQSGIYYLQTEFKTYKIIK
jgi:hypothetical protein